MIEKLTTLHYNVDNANQYWDSPDYRVFCIKQEQNGSFCYLSSNETNNRLFKHAIRLGVDIREFTSTSLANMLYRNYRKWISQQGVFSYIAVLPDGNTWETRIEAKDNLVYGIGTIVEKRHNKQAQLNDNSKKINSYSMQENLFLCVVLSQKDDSFFVESLDGSRVVRELASTFVDQKADVLFKDATNISDLKIVEKSLFENKIIQYYETINAVHFHVTVTPLLSLKKVMITAVTNEQNSVQQASQKVPNKSSFHPTCTIVKNTDSEYVLADSNLLFNKFVKSSNVTLQDITNSSVFKDRFQKLSRTFGALPLEHSGERGTVFLECIPTVFHTTEIATICHLSCEEEIAKIDLMCAMLTKRESEVLSFVVEGYSNQGIAENLSISIGTVKKLIYNCYKKLGVSSRFELVNFIYSD